MTNMGDDLPIHKYTVPLTNINPKSPDYFPPITPSMPMPLPLDEIDAAREPLPPVRVPLRPLRTYRARREAGLRHQLAHYYGWHVADQKALVYYAERIKEVNKFIENAKRMQDEARQGYARASQEFVSHRRGIRDLEAERANIRRDRAQIHERSANLAALEEDLAVRRDRFQRNYEAVLNHMKQVRDQVTVSVATDGQEGAVL